MRKLISRLFRNRPPRTPEFDGRFPEVSTESPRIQQMLDELALEDNPENSKTILTRVSDRMDAAVRLARQKSHEALMQAHQETVETQTLLLAWTNRFRPESPEPRERDLFRKTYMEVLAFMAVLRISFVDLPLPPSDPDDDGKHVYYPIRDHVRSGPFCSHCLRREGKPHLLAHSPDADIHLKCPNCELP